MTVNFLLGILFLLMFGFVGIVAKLNKAQDAIWLPPIYQSRVVQGVVSLFALLSFVFLIFLFLWSWKLALMVLAIGAFTLKWLLVPITERLVLVPLVTLLSLIFRVRP